MMRPSPAASHAREASAGFTLLELLVVVGVLAVLMGLGVGFLRGGGGGGIGEARSAIGAQLRAAALTARTRAVPTEVHVEPGPPGKPGVVRARLLEPVLALHFEPGDRTLNLGLEPRLGGQDEPRGRYGHARRPADGKREALASVPLGGVLDLRDGFALRLEVWLEERQPCVLARLGSNLELALDGQGVPRARMVQRGADGRGGTAAVLQASQALPLHRWATLELVADRTSFRCLLDGVELARAPAGESVQQQAGDVLDLSAADAPVPGALDEIVLLVFQEAEPLPLPLDVTPEAEVVVRFGRDGEPVEPGPIVLQLPGDQGRETLRVGRGGALR